MEFNAQSPADLVATYLATRFGTMVDFADNIGEDLPIEALVEAMSIVNTVIGSDVDLVNSLATATGDPNPTFYMHYGVTADNAMALGRAEDILVYLAEDDTAHYGCDNWMAYIEEAREAE
jgi:hypothetical protein